MFIKIKGPEGTNTGTAWINTNKIEAFGATGKPGTPEGAIKNATIIRTISGEIYYADVPMDTFAGLVVSEDGSDYGSLYDPTEEELVACIDSMAAGLSAFQVLGDFLKSRREKLLR